MNKTRGHSPLQQLLLSPCSPLSTHIAGLGTELVWDFARFWIKFHLLHLQDGETVSNLGSP